MQKYLFIGGPVDGQKLDVDPLRHFWPVAENALTDDGSRRQVLGHSYTRETLDNGLPGEHRRQWRVYLHSGEPRTPENARRIILWLLMLGE